MTITNILNFVALIMMIALFFALYKFIASVVNSNLRKRMKIARQQKKQMAAVEAEPLEQPIMGKKVPKSNDPNKGAF